MQIGPSLYLPASSAGSPGSQRGQGQVAPLWLFSSQSCGPLLSFAGLFISKMRGFNHWCENLSHLGNWKAAC